MRIAPYVLIVAGFVTMAVCGAPKWAWGLEFVVYGVGWALDRRLSERHP